MMELLEFSKSKNIREMLIVANNKRITKEMVDNLKKSRNKQVLDALLDNPEILLSDLL